MKCLSGVNQFLKAVVDLRILMGFKVGCGDGGLCNYILFLWVSYYTVLAHLGTDCWDFHKLSVASFVSKND